jgi:hypothetical protein
MTCIPRWFYLEKQKARRSLPRSATGLKTFSTCLRKGAASWSSDCLFALNTLLPRRKLGNSPMVLPRRGVFKTPEKDSAASKEIRVAARFVFLIPRFVPRH